LEFWNGLVGLFHMSSILGLGVLLFVGFYLGKLFERLNLPPITGYILAGLILGPHVLGVVTEDTRPTFGPITQIALGLIALTIGGEFSYARIKRSGLNIAIITLFEALLAFAVVTAVLSLCGVDTPVALILGSIAAATAPAATVIIIRMLKARGEFIDYLYGVVAFDDAICVILFGIVFAFVTPVLTGAAVSGSVAAGFLHAVTELLHSVLLGVAGGFLLHLLIRGKYRVTEVLLISLSFLFVVTALATVLHLSSLIANMTMGAALVNFSPRNRRVFDVLEPLAPPIFALFFILAGTELHTSVFVRGGVVLIGVIYLTARFLGKLAGVYVGSTIARAPERVRKYLGFCLFPQAGVAIGLALFVESSPVTLSASAETREMLSLIVNIILFSVFVNELIGPSISKFGIKKGLGL
jgi:Kef-type K+ transport system membrane component KefB